MKLSIQIGMLIIAVMGELLILSLVGHVYSLLKEAREFNKRMESVQMTFQELCDRIWDLRDTKKEG